MKPALLRKPPSGWGQQLANCPGSNIASRPRLVRHVIVAAAKPQRGFKQQMNQQQRSASAATTSTTTTTTTTTTTATTATTSQSGAASPPPSSSSAASSSVDSDASSSLELPYTLLTDDPTELAEMIERMRLDNKRTREALHAALDDLRKSAPPPPPSASASSSSLSSPPPPQSSSSSPPPVSSVAAAAASAHSLSIEGARADDVDAELSWVLGGSPPSVTLPATATFATYDFSSSDEDSSSGSDEEEELVVPQATTTQPSPPASPPPSATRVTDVVFVTAEAAPYSKTGGLGDVLGALPRAMAARSAAHAAAASSSSSSSSSSAPRREKRGLGGRVMVVLPRYMSGSASDDVYKNAADTGVTATLHLGNCGPQQVRFYHERTEVEAGGGGGGGGGGLSAVDWVFVDHPSYHRPGNPYGDAAGVFGDNQFRFSLLSLAALEAPLHLRELGYGREFKSEEELARERKGEEDASPSATRTTTDSGEDGNEKLLQPFGSRRFTFVANDWHAGCVPLYLAHKFRPHGVYADARCLFVIHNLSHQGVEPAHTFDALGFPGETAWRAKEQLHWEYPSWASINGDAVNILKGAVLASDRILTVSSGYAWEVQTPEGGWGLHDVLRSRSHVLNGVTNGINVGEWDPSRDKALPFNYSSEDLSGKKKCKAALQEELGLRVDDAVPLVGWIGRLDYQKGPDLLLAAVGELAARDVQVVMLGSGSASLENDMRAAEEKYPNHFRGWVGFSVPVSHRITAGADVVLMNSRFEPCGLNQLHAAAYGTPVVAHATGGLRDTIVDAGRLMSGSGDDDDEVLKKAGPSPTAEEVGTGWLFSPPEAQPMLAAVDAAVHTWRHRPKRWRAMQRAAMGQDLSWAKAADEYATVIDWAHIDPPVVQ